MFTVNLNFHQLPKIKGSFLQVTILATMSLASGIIPNISSQPRIFTRENTVYAQEYSPEEVYNYAKAGFEVEMLRQQVYQEIKSVVNEPPPNIVCDRPETIDSIPDNIQGIANNYCDRVPQIVEENNLSIQRFNQLKNDYDRGGSFYQQVQEQLLNLQN